MAISHASEPDYGIGEKKLSVYGVGILLCIVLTLIPFGVVMSSDLSYAKTLVIIFASGIMQFIVQVLCFLRLNYSTEQAKINVLSFILSMAILIIIVGGSLWIMWHLHYRMMH